jgi:hypothetical protein
MAAEPANIDQTLLASIVMGAIAKVGPVQFTEVPTKTGGTRQVVAAEDNAQWEAQILSQVAPVATLLSLKGEIAKQAATVAERVPAADVDQALLTLVLDGAIAAAGPASDSDDADWQARVIDRVAPVVTLLSPKGDAVKVAQSVLNCIRGVNKSAVFVAPEVLSIQKEASSTRGIVTFRTDDLVRHPDGTEQIRTERSDSPVGLAMCQRIRQDLVGHKVVVYKELQPMGRGDGQSAKVIVHLVDLGLADAD